MRAILLRYSCTRCGNEILIEPQKFFRGAGKDKKWSLKVPSYCDKCTDDEPLKALLTENWIELNEFSEEGGSE